MSEPKHTPGPWTLNVLPFRIEVQTEPGKCYCFTLEDIANARLIAAAPELLAALDDVMLWIKNWSPMFTEENEWAATAALVEKAKAKVEGRAA